MCILFDSIFYVLTLHRRPVLSIVILEQYDDDEGHFTNSDINKSRNEKQSN